VTTPDITDPDDTLSLSQACRTLPRGRNGSRPHLSTLLRWIRDGVGTPDGHRVRLGAVRIGSRWVTSRRSLQAFAEALTPQTDIEQAPVPRTPGQRSRASERAAQVLESAGI
jgi:hypothetical protein